MSVHQQIHSLKTKRADHFPSTDLRQCGASVVGYVCISNYMHGKYTISLPQTNKICDLLQKGASASLTFELNNSFCAIACNVLF